MACTSGPCQQWENEGGSVAERYRPVSTPPSFLTQHYPRGGMLFATLSGALAVPRSKSDLGL